MNKHAVKSITEYRKAGQQMQPKNEMETEELKLQKAFSGMSDEEIQDTKIMIITKDGLPFCVKIKDLPKWREKGLID